MTCFKCKTYLYRRKISGVPVHECPGCKGVWINQGQIPNLQKEFSISLDRSEIVSSYTNYECSHCDEDIKEIKIKQNGRSVDLDECTSCKGVWFDYCELQKFHELFKGVNQVFNSKRIQRQRGKTVWKEKLSNVYDEKNPVAKESTLTRNKFIAKVYRLFMLSLLTGAIGAGAGVLFGLGYKYFWELFIVEIAILIWAMCVRKDKKWNLLALFSFTTFSGFTISPLLNVAISQGQGDLIPIAFGLTTVLFGSLTWYVHKTKKDFSFMSGFLWSGLLLMVVSGFLGLLIPGLINTLIHCSIGILLFSGFILYDTSRIILKYDVTEYVSAALDLYLDFLNIFVDIFRVLLETSDISDFFDIF